MRFLLSALLMIGCLVSAEKPDLSGIWILDGERSAQTGVYGQVRIVTQTASEVNMTAIQYLGRARRYDILPWTFRLDRWGPRRPPYDQPITRGGWDGETFIAVKSPGENYSVLWKWHLLRPDELAIDAINWTYLPNTFDFRETSIPKYYIPDTFIYRKLLPDQ